MLKKISSFLEKNKLIVTIAIFAAAIRFIGVTTTPPALNWDEVSHGYNAYSILKTGKDEWGQVFPLMFRAYGDYKLPGYIYTTVISEAFFGLNAFAVRLPSVLAGIGLVIFTYLLAKELFDRKIGLIAAVLVSIEPWSFFLSRAALEANLAQLLIVSGTYYFIKFTKGNVKSILLSIILFGLSVWTYNSARIFVPLLILLLLLLFKKEVNRLQKGNKLHFYLSCSIFILFFVPMFWQLISPNGLARFNWVSILDSGAISKIDNLRINSTFPPLITRALYNKVTYFALIFTKNWLSHFSPDFLFLKGGTNYQFSIPGRGILFPVDIVTIILGALYLLKRKSKTSVLILGWLFLAPIPSSLTKEAPQVLRDITTLPIPMILSSLGVYYFATITKFKVNRVVTIYLIIIFLFFWSYAVNYFGNYRKDYSWSWQYGYKEVVDLVSANYSKYDTIIITKDYGEPHEFVLFYLKYDPTKYRENPNLIRFFETDWYWIDRFDKFYFVNEWNIKNNSGSTFELESKGQINCTGKKCLLITGPDKTVYGWQFLKDINFLDGSTAFRVFSNINGQ